jgi:hypothetical protein
MEAPTLNDQQDPENVTQRINNRVVLYHHESVGHHHPRRERLNAEYKKQKLEKKPDGK